MPVLLDYAQQMVTSIIKGYLVFNGNTFYDVFHLKSKPWNLNNLAIEYKVFSNKNTDWISSLTYLF